MLKTAELLARTREVAMYIVENKTTIRQAAKKFGISKSTVHRDLTKWLKKEDTELYYKVQEVITYNISQRAIRGGEATKRKYKK